MTQPESSQVSADSPQPMLHLWIGGMENCGREAAVRFLVEPQEKTFPESPRIYYAVGVPIIWLWYEITDKKEPELPLAFDKNFFGIHYVFTQAEFMEIHQKQAEAGGV